MLIRKLHGGRRRGATAVETAFVLLPMIIFVFGVFEYGRFIMILNMFNNAAREGVRYALVNNTATTIGTDVTNIVNARLGSQVGTLTKLKVTVTGTHLGVNTTVNNLVAGDLITVTVTGTYSFMNIIPVLPVPKSVNLSSAPTMVCEGAS